MIKSTTRTIRISEDLDKAIEKLAREEKTSVNFIVNYAIRERVEWTSIVPKLGFGTYPTYLTDMLFAKLTDRECEETGRKVALEFLKPLVEYRFGSSSPENWVQITRDFSRYTGQFEFLMEKRDGVTILILSHRSGIKASYFYEGAGRYIYGEALGMKIRTEITNTSCTIRISGPDSLALN
jgi:hypothetical protein